MFLFFDFFEKSENEWTHEDGFKSSNEDMFIVHTSDKTCNSHTIQSGQSSFYFIFIIFPNKTWVIHHFFPHHKYIAICPPHILNKRIRFNFESNYLMASLTRGKIKIMSLQFIFPRWFETMNWWVRNSSSWVRIALFNKKNRSKKQNFCYRAAVVKIWKIFQGIFIDGIQLKRNHIINCNK